MPYKNKDAEKLYRERNKEKIAARRIAYNAKPENRAMAVARVAKWRNANPKKYENQKKKQYRINKHQMNARVQEWRSKNRERHNAQNRDWAKRNKDKILAKTHKRRAMQRNARGKWGAGDLVLLRKVLGKTCMRCGSKDRISIDHVVPITKGGTNYPANLQFLCRSCNSGKNNRTKEHRSRQQITHILKKSQLHLFKEQ